MSESAMTVLRRMLDERGVEYQQTVVTKGTLFTVSTDKEHYFILVRDCDAGFEMWSQYFTPEQTIAATLGRGECRNISKVVDKYGQARFACSECGAWLDSRMLWNPEYPNGESPWVKDCKLNYCPNCGRKVVDD